MKHLQQSVPYVCACLLVLLAACSSQDNADVIIHNADIIDVESGDVLTGHSVFITDGRITRVAAADRSNGPVGDANVIDATGLYLIPGLWDMHVHFRGGSDLVRENRALLGLYIANGVTTVRDAGGDITDSIMEWRRQIEQGTVTGPRILTSGPKLDGPTGGWDGSIRLSSATEVPAAIDSLQALGVDYIKIYDGTISRDVYLAIIGEARRRQMTVTGHMPMSVGFREAVAQGLNATEHLYYAFKGTAANEDSITEAVIARNGSSSPLGFRQALSLVGERHDEDAAQTTYARMAEAGTAVVPTLHIGAVLANVDTADHSGDAELQYIHPDIQATYARRVGGARRSSEQAREDRRELQRTFVSMVPAMHAAGVTVLAGSDAGPFNSFVYPGFSLHAELQELVDAGLTPLQALRAATIEPAQFMGRGMEYGLIAEGYQGDLVLLESNPLDEISNTLSVRTVILGGATILDRGDLDALLTTAREQAQAP